MRKNLLVIMVLLALLPFQMKADWVSLDQNKTANTPPQVTLISDDNSSTVIKIDLAGFDITEFITEGKLYQSVDLLNEIFSNEPGFPGLPYIAKVLAIPNQAGISVEVLETGEIQTFEDIYLPPARVSWYEGASESPYVEDIKAYQSDKVYPKEYVRVEPPSIFRDFRIARISVFPVRYKPASKELQVVSSITIRVNYGPGEVINPKIAPKRPIAPSFGKLYRSFLFNYESVLNKLYGGKEEGHELMLCIMDDMFVESFQVYADWNRQSGTDVHVTAFSDIGANSNNPDIIKNHISDAYYNWEIAPTYVLIVGDDGVFPKKIVTYPNYSFPNEDYFVEVEGNDHFPEAMIGRFTNQGDYRMQVMINKMMLYEKEPYIEETDWFKKGVCCSNNLFPTQVETKRYAAGLMLEDGQFISVDTMMSDGWGSGCTYNLYDVMNVINDGRSFLNYRGEGWSSGWSASCYYFNTSDVSNLNNGEKFTFVTSIGCGVAMFDTYGGNCFGEEWIQLGSLSAPRGAVAFVGPVSNTHTTYNNKIDKGIYTGLFWEGMDTPGQALLRGKLYMFNVFGTNYMVEYHYRVYCILGDPSLHVWMDIPLEVNVEHPSLITVGNNELEITTTFASNGLPVANAQVCLTGNDLFATAISDTLGKVIIEVEPELEDTFIVTVRGGNVYPYQDTIEVVQPGEHIEPYGDPVIVDLDGNMDGLINPNENCNITYTLKNWGTLTANNIQATLTSANPDLVEIISTDPVSFGNLNPGSSFTGDPFQFYVKPECPVGEIITLQLHVSSSTSSWDYDLNTEVLGCRLINKNFLVIDSTSMNMNCRMDPGETVNLQLSIENYGEDIASNVMGILSCNNQYITIVDSIGTFGTLDTGNLAINAEDYYIVSVDASCPVGYWAEYTLKLYTQDGNYPYEIMHIVNIPVSLPIPADYTGPDTYGYYAYASTDAFYEQTPVYDWFELEGTGTEINIPYVSDYTVTKTLPFTFKYYGIPYTQIRISTDGWIAFGSGTQTAPVNTALPNYDDVNSMAAAFWDDLYNIEIEEGNLYYYDDAANHRYIVQWDSISHNIYGGEPIREAFQTILFDPEYYPTTTEDGEIIYQYKKVDKIDSLTIGIENHSQNIGLQYVFNEEYDATSAEIMNGLAIKFTTEPPFGYMITSDGDENLINGISNGFGLEQNRPNPFSSNTWINYSLPKQSNVTLNIYSINGELVRTLQNGKQSNGQYSIEWNGLNDLGIPVNSGVYFYRLQTEGFIQTKKMFLLK